MLDACRGDCDTAVVITNDSDLREPLRLACDELGLTTGVINPHKASRRSRAPQATFFSNSGPVHSPLASYASARPGIPDQQVQALGDQGLDQGLPIGPPPVHRAHARSRTAGNVVQVASSDLGGVASAIPVYRATEEIKRLV